MPPRPLPGLGYQIRNLCCIHILSHIHMSRHKSYVAMHSISYVSLSGCPRLRPRPPLPERANILVLRRGTFQYNNVLAQTVRKEVRIEKASLQHMYQLLVCIPIQKTLWHLR